MVKLICTRNTCESSPGHTDAHAALPSLAIPAFDKMSMKFSFPWGAQLYKMSKLAVGTPANL